MFWWLFAAGSTCLVLSAFMAAGPVVALFSVGVILITAAMLYGASSQ